MSFAFQCAIITLAVFVGILAALGSLVLAKIFIAAVKLKNQLGNVPAQLKQRQAALNAAQAKIVEAQKKLGADKAEAEALMLKAKLEANGGFEKAADAEIAEARIAGSGLNNGGKP